MIEVSNLKYSYPGSSRALNGISLQIPAGSYVAIMGANGSGKSTLLRHLNGLLLAESGSVSVGGITVSRESFERINQLVGFVFQDPNDQLFAPTVAEDIGYGPRNLGLAAAEIKERVEWAAAAVGASDLLDRPIHALSYGQQKRVSIAGVLAMRPQVLVLDEPTASLDPMAERKIMRLLRDLNEKEKMTVIMATHDVDLIPLYAKQVCLLRKGEIEVQGSLASVFADHELVRHCDLRLPRISYLFDMFADLPELPLTVGMARKELMRMVGCGELKLLKEARLFDVEEEIA